MPASAWAGSAVRCLRGTGLGVDFDPEWLDPSRRTYPDLPMVDSRLDELTREKLTAAGHPAAYDLIVCVGNVIVLLRPIRSAPCSPTWRGAGARRPAAGRLRHDRGPGRRLTRGPGRRVRRRRGRRRARGESRFSTYDLRAFTDGSTYAVHVLQHAT